MSLRDLLRRRLALLLALSATAAALSGCVPAASDSSGAAPAQAGDAAVQAGDAAATPDDAGASPTAPMGYPTCDEVKAALGPEAASLAALPDADNGEKIGSDGQELSCTWATPQMQAQSIDVKNYGALSLGIMHDPTYSEEANAELGWTIDDPRLAADDAWALTAGGHYDPGAPVGASSVQVVRDGTVVVIAGGGATLHDVPELAALTQSWAVGAGLAVLDLMR